jgi:hypothetical protein
METGFPNPIEPRIKSKKVKSPWNFEAPHYDERNRIAAGDNYGVGFNQPIGRRGDPLKKVAVLPDGHPKTMRADNIRRTPLNMRGSSNEDKDE